MPNLSWSEVRDGAIAFSRRWIDERSEAGGKQTFWNEFFAVFGRERRTVAAFEVAVKNLTGKYNYIDLLWKGMLLVEHKSAGKSLDIAESQAFGYIADLAREGRHDEIPRYVIVSDFARIALYDLEPEEQKDLPIFAGMHYATLSFPLAEFHKYVRHFAFIKGERTIRLDPEDPANEKAYDLMCRLHDELEKLGFTGTDLERLLVRLLFCLFADDTDVFEPTAFETFITQQTREDGSDVGARLNELFYLLNKPETQWMPSAKETFAGFRYINGELFRDQLAFPPFSRSTRKALMDACDFQWAKVSPAVFGSLFQGIMDDVTRRQQGAHYTSERDIMKLIRSLFLDDLRTEFETIKADSRKANRIKRLEEFQSKLRTLKFLDPACGCGNFLVLGYRELRLLELDILREIHSGADIQRVLNIRDLILVDVDQFYGIEYAEWPTRIAEVAMWLMDHQMNKLVSQAFGKSFERLPLQSSPHIVQGNALRIDWRTVLPPADGVYVMGNPPFVGAKFQSSEQKQDIAALAAGFETTGLLDYVTGWYLKAADYIQGSTISVGFVSTNSISQGEQVGVLWSNLFRFGLRIQFAHRTFAWMSEARGRAHVHVVIIGFSVQDRNTKYIYEYEGHADTPTVTTAANISPYLCSGPNTVILNRSMPLCDVPAIGIGNKPIDGGNYLFTTEEKEAFLKVEPQAKKWFRRWLGSDEFINGWERWCLWLGDCPPEVLHQMPEVLKRVEAVREFRLASRSLPTQKLAATPTRFHVENMPKHHFIVLPKVSSVRRAYIPIGYMSPATLVSDLCFINTAVTVFHFGVLTSQMHMAWVRQVCGRLKSDYRYSAKLVYNNFPWPLEATAKKKAAVETAAQRVLDARLGFLPPNGKSTLADLYDPLTMPPALSKAHAALDRAVDRCYRSEPFRSDRERVEHLFAMYERLTAPLLPTAEKPAKRTRKPKQSTETPPTESNDE